MTTTKWLVFIVAWVALSWVVPVGAEWVAYNDSLRQPGDATAQNVTGWTIHNNDRTHFTGRLVDFETGSDVGMPTVTFTMGGAGLSVSSGAAGGNPAPGTDAYEIFNGIVDLGPDVVYYGSAGWWVEIEFTGLVPENTYSFVGTAIRCRDYPDRVSLFTILDTPSFINNSSEGVVERAGAVTKLLAGDNRATGYVVRWDEIVPSAAGTFKVRAEAAPGSADGKAYPFGAFMLEEVGLAGNRPPEVDAGDYDVLVWPVHSLQLKPIVHDDDPCDLGLLAYAWSKVSGPGAVRFDPADNMESPTAIFSEPGEYELMVQVWDELGQEGNATTSITIAQPLLGDFNGDNRVNWLDLVPFAAQWLDPAGSPADLNITHGVDLVDFAIVAENWRIGEGATLVINEVMARNDMAVADPQGEYEDWIELYNGGEDAVDVGGMYLTDDPSEPTRWRIPTGDPVLTTIFPGGHLLIWADNDVTDPGLHAGFELNAGGDDVALFDTDGSTLIDGIQFGGQTPDVSFGREPDAATNLVTLAPTPAASNNGAFLAVVGDTRFSHDRGFYSEPFAVTVTTSTEGAIIRYTTDGSTPSLSHGNVYTAPIPIATTTALRAMAFKPGWKSTNVDTHTYIFLDDVIRQATHPTTGAQVTPTGYPTSWGSVTGDYQVDPDVVGQNGTDIFGGLYARTFKDDMKAAPTISLVMDKDDWFGSQGIYINKSQDGTERVASIEYIDPNAEEDFQVNCAMAMQGGVSGGGTSLNRWKSFKLSMRPRFKTQTDDGTPTGGPPKLAFKLFKDSPVERHNTVVLDAVLNHSWLHPSSGQRDTAMYVQDQYVADLHNAMGGYSPHGAYAHIYINGLYWGMYYIHERPDHAWAAQMFGGDEDEYDAIKHNPNGVINNGTGGSATANYNAMLAAVNALASDSGNVAKYRAVCEVLDVDSLITYLLANWHPGNHDWPHKNWYATHRNTPDGKWRIHSWDAEHSVEGSNDVGESPSDLHSKLARSAEYRIRFADHIQRHFFNGGVLTYPATADLYALRMSQIDRAIVGESARWGDNRQSRPYTRQDWANTQAGKLTGFFPNRSNEVLSRLKNAGLYPNVSAPGFLVNGLPQHGGHVDSGDALMMGPGTGTIYYTLDGADPRLPGGLVNAATARPYTGPVTLSESSVVKARARSGSTWSALNEAVFAVGPVAESLRISEIMYHPADMGNPDDPNTEFIELTNIGAETLNLNLVTFTNGVDFTFPSFELAPNDYCLVVRDIDAFQAKYGFGLNVAGQYVGSLNNAGERIELRDAAGQLIHDFRFQDDWYDITDGLGFSLTVTNPATVEPTGLGDKSAWRPSAAPGGAPGSDDSGDVPEPGAVVINELLANSDAASSDWIELHNTAARTISIGGWFLSDEGDELTKYEIAPGTVISAGGYLVFSEDLHFGNDSDPGCHDAFALSSGGETVYLHSGSDGVLGGYSDQEKFGASDPGVSLGRYQKSTGTYNFVALSIPTPGAENAAPRVGPVVITEIMYHPDEPADAEYVELLNIGTTPVTLYDAARDAPWRFTDDPDNPGIEFLFPIDPPITLSAGEYVVLVKDVVVFDAKFTLPPGVQVFAWGTGNLANGNERVQLSKPGGEEAEGSRSWIRVDRVVYSDGAHPAGVDPWPAEPDGRGSSLTRVDPTAYGNDPINWAAAAPSPGR